MDGDGWAIVPWYLMSGCSHGHQFEEYGYPGWAPGQFNARSVVTYRYFGDDRAGCLEAVGLTGATMVAP